MFFYLFYNSSILKNNSEQQKNISTLIYGSIIYIILHSILFFKNNSDFIVNFQKYFWILFTLDCIAVLFTHISKNDTIFINKLNFEKDNIKNELQQVKNTIPIIKKKASSKKNINIQIKPKKNVRFDDSKSETDVNSDVNSEVGSASGSDYDLDEFEKMLTEN